MVRVLPLPDPDADLWSLESSVTSPRCSDGSGAAPSTANETCILIVANIAFPGKKLAQSWLKVAEHGLCYGCPSFPYCPCLSFCQTCAVLCSGVFGSVEGPAFEEGQASELVTSFKSSRALDSSQSQCTPISKFTAKWWVHESKGFPVEMKMALSLYSSPARGLVLDLQVSVQKHTWLNSGNVSGTLQWVFFYLAGWLRGRGYGHVLLRYLVCCLWLTFTSPYSC